VSFTNPTLTSNEILLQTTLQRTNVLLESLIKRDNERVAKERVAKETNSLQQANEDEIEKIVF